MGIRGNQIEDQQISSSKIVPELEASLKYVGTIGFTSFTDPKELVNKAYVDGAVAAANEGRDVKESVRAGTTGNLPAASTGVSVGAYLESLDPDFGDLVLDGVSLNGGDRVLVKNEGGGVGQVKGFIDDGGGSYRFVDTSEYGRFFEFTDADGSTWYVWFNDGSALDPSGAPTPANQPSGAFGIEVTFPPASLAPAIVAAAKTAIDLMGITALTVLDYSPDLVLLWETQPANNDNSTISDAAGAGSMPVTSISQVQDGDADAVLGVRNGIYEYQDTSGNTQAWRLVRTTDFDEDPEVTANAFTWISEGLTQADSGWTLVSDDPITVDTSGQVWTQYNGLSVLVAGEALLKTGNTLDVLYNDVNIGIDGTNKLQVKNNSLIGNVLNDDPLAAGLDGGFWMEDSPYKVSYLNSTVADRKPQFGAAVQTTGSITGTFQIGEIITFQGGGQGRFLGFDNPFTPTQIYYIPLDGTAPAAGVATGATSGATISVNATPNDQRGNTPDGVTKAFDLSVRFYTFNEGPTPSVQPIPSTLQVWRNGVLQKNYNFGNQGAYHATLGEGYYELNNTSGQITFGVAPAYGEEIVARYVPEEGSGE